MKNRLKIERAILDLTQDELANKIGVSRQTISSIEKNSIFLVFKNGQCFMNMTLISMTHQNLRM